VAQTPTASGALEDGAHQGGRNGLGGWAPGSAGHERQMDLGAGALSKTSLQKSGGRRGERRRRV
jgi:hypothetical protein